MLVREIIGIKLQKFLGPDKNCQTCLFCVWPHLFPNMGNRTGRSYGLTFLNFTKMIAMAFSDNSERASQDVHIIHNFRNLDP